MLASWDNCLANCHPIQRPLDFCSYRFNFIAVYCIVFSCCDASCYAAKSKNGSNCCSRSIRSLISELSLCSRQLRWVISSCSLWETNGTVLSSLEDYPGVTHVISNGLHVISLFSCEI